MDENATSYHNVVSSRYIDESVAPKLLDSGELRELAYRTAVESSVLLRNMAPPGPNRDVLGTSSKGTCSRQAQLCFLITWHLRWQIWCGRDSPI